jgi:hypothetical protein
MVLKATTLLVCYRICAVALHVVEEVGVREVRWPLNNQSNLLWVLPVNKRAWAAELVLQSLNGAGKVLVSTDSDSQEMERVLAKFDIDVIKHPWSCARHPSQFPADAPALNNNFSGDTYGHARSSWATCLKHHWWWMMKQAWARTPDRVCVLEEDTVVHPQALEWLSKQNGDSIKLTPEHITVPWCMTAKQWQKIDPETFCKHDDYNWDQTIAWMMEHGHGPNQAIVPHPKLSMHIGLCGGWNLKGPCPTRQVKQIRESVLKWRATRFTVTASLKKLTNVHERPNGGWAHPADWAHCLEPGTVAIDGNDWKIFNAH